MSRPELGRSSVFGLEKRLQFFGLRTGSSEIDRVEVRDKLGSCGAAQHTNFFPLFFSRLQTKTFLLPPPHNRQVEGGRPLPFKSFWAHHFHNFFYRTHPPSMPEMGIGKLTSFDQRNLASGLKLLPYPIL